MLHPPACPPARLPARRLQLGAAAPRRARRCACFAPLTGARGWWRRREAGRLLADWQRLNVAVTRAKHKLLLVGSATTLASVPLLARMLELLRGRGWLVRLDAAVAQALE